MKSVTEAFLETLRGSHPIAVRARVVPAFTTGANPDGLDIPVEAGSVQMDATADVRATLDLTTDGTDWDPRPGEHPIQTYGDEVYVSRGGWVGDQIEWVGLGYFRIYDVEQTSPPHGPLRVSGQDRMSFLVDAQLTAPRQFKATQSVSGVFDALVHDVLPDAVIEFDDDDTANALLERAQIADQDRYGFLRDLANSHGKTMYFDHRGVLVVRTPPDVTNPVWDVDAGQNGVLVEASRAISRDGVFNGVVCEGEAPSGDSDAPPVRVLAYDANPDSPTYWHGRYGQVPTFYTSSLITRIQQCASAARAKLERSLGTPYNVDFSAVPNPALEPFDPVRIRYAETTGREIHIVDTVTVPLTAAEAMTATTRQQYAVLISIEGSD